jgi:YfiH family protein
MMVHSIRFFKFDSLSERSIPHAIFQRQGGVSPKPWHSLNLGGGLGDDSGRVSENRDLALKSVDRLPSSVYDVWQVHSIRAVRATAARGSEHPIRADIIVTDKPEVTLLMRFADCVPIMVHDPEHNAVGIAHAGWLGTIQNASSRLVQFMTDEFGSKPRKLIAGIGPSIGPCHYEVGKDVIESVHHSFGAEGGAFLTKKESGIYFDLWSANRYQLEQTGLEQIEVSEICTACHNRHWYSHRAERGRTGRFGAIIACKNA